MDENVMDDIQRMQMQLLACQTLIAVLLAKTSPTVRELERVRRAVRRSAAFHPMQEQDRDSSSEYAATLEDLFLSASLLTQHSAESTPHSS
ncbi:hypothetical protein [Paraburkholderia sp.]|uniref:hypothetical protein n=1 Tax=Paraburkholderia sp. TaxID=1926495 RepID=UPI0039E5E0DD